ncbi:radical SAM protein [Candidatus Lokiarchaeum ossiferum]|uniref:radical SAM protein n=1 Tax=Candidatus Lokiarchaeum ossiferum TaxID=2951803 RepID=UPI00352D61FC
MTTSGTLEWASSNVNIQKGCKNGCKYCYAARMAVRFKRCSNLMEWTTQIQVDPSKVQKNYRKRNGRIMFPTSHDIYTSNLIPCLDVLDKLLKSGNEVLITTKPEDYCIEEICDEFQKYKDQIQFRFTIGSAYNAVLKKWEPNAPSFDERVSALKRAYFEGFKTSISIEPYLDYYPHEVIEEVEPFVTETIWLGIMNSKIPKEGRELYNKKLYSKDFVSSLVKVCTIKAKGKLRLKDSIKNLFKEKRKKNERGN